MKKMGNGFNELKAEIAACVAFLTSLWGWFGWLCGLWLFCMALDYITGSAAAIRAGEWSSKAARDGIWHKMGSIVAVLVAGILDMTIGTILENIPSVPLPFDYTVFFAPLVVVWYILTECGSLMENASALGTSVPHWLVKSLAALKTKVDETADVQPDDGETKDE